MFEVFCGANILDKDSHINLVTKFWTDKKLHIHISVKNGGSSISTGVVVGISVGCAFLVLGLIGVGIYAIRQKKRAEKAIGLSRPFGNEKHM